MNKICTSIEQSKKLLELGVDVNTADMYYEEVCNSSKAIIGNYILHNQCMEDKDYKKLSNPVLSPAWSISALLGLMPKLYEFENDPDDGGCQPNLCKGWDNNQWHIVYRSSIYITEWYDEPIDAAFEMIVWLKENNKL